MTEKKAQTRLSHDSFAAILEEFLSGPCTATALVQASGMTHRYVNKLLRTMKARKIVHVSGFEKDAIGRNGVKVYALGAGTDAKKERTNKPRAQVQREFRARRRSRDLLQGTPFQGLPVMASNDSTRRAA